MNRKYSGTAIVGIGGNLGDREENLKNAVTSLDRLINSRVERKSDIFETEPVGYKNQPDFLNMTVEVQTDLSPRTFLGACLGIESALFRKRNFKNGPRLIDIDLLLFAKKKEDEDEYELIFSDDPELYLPHPRMFERGFVLKPLENMISSDKIFGIDFSKKLQNIEPGTVRYYKKYEDIENPQDR
jgi:2-amino-4-hydroxy-6-hydroxymethyldihydropteridine diphosphokinase